MYKWKGAPPGLRSVICPVCAALIPDTPKNRSVHLIWHGTKPDSRSKPDGTTLRNMRVRSGLNQTELGLLVGVSQRTVSNWENGATCPHPTVAVKLAKILNVDVDTILIDRRVKSI